MQYNVNTPFALRGPKNVRELGGYPTQDGRRTKEHVFLRADGLDALTGKDRRFLRQYPIGLVIDLRSGFESRLAPDRLDQHFEQVHVPMFDHVQSELARRRAEGSTGLDTRVPDTLAEIYVLLAETEKDEIRTVLRMLIDADKPALFHCTAGKDRTGITAMFLLEMAGVPEEIILADYTATARYLGSAYGFAIDAEDDIPTGAFDARAENMITLRKHLEEKYGSVLGYLRDLGFSDEDFRKLREKFTEVR